MNRIMLTHGVCKNVEDEYMLDAYTLESLTRKEQETLLLTTVGGLLAHGFVLLEHEISCTILKRGKTSITFSNAGIDYTVDIKKGNTSFSFNLSQYKVRLDSHSITFTQSFNLLYCNSFTIVF